MFRREYFPSDTLKLINQSEGRAGISGKGAHALSRHLLKGSPGAVLYDTGTGTVGGVGVDSDTFRDRFKNASPLPSGDMPVNSGWTGKGDMAVLLCELLNSPVGQVALGQLDSGTKRVSVHYLNLGKLAKLFYGLAGGLQMNVAETTITPATVQEVLVQKTNPKSGALIQYMQKNKIPEQRTGNVKAAGIASVAAVLDNVGGDLHLQTFFPAHYAVESHAGWSVGQVCMVATVNPSGQVTIRITPKSSGEPD
jgi:hypothetical protein